jgi:predicted aminopeptidase
MVLAVRPPHAALVASRWCGPALALAALQVSAACATPRYLWQAAWGQLDLQSRAEPVDRLIASGRVPPRLRALLEQLPAIKEFGTRHGLELSASYGEYAELDRDAAVWVVTACAPLRFSPKTWSFPLVGSFPYLGWFDAGAAAAYADGLAREGWDVHVRAAPAYSTLGWFDDPLLSTMLVPGPNLIGDLADTVLHEAVHATVHLPGQTVFNESIALFIAEGLTPRYLAERYGADGAEVRAYLDDLAWRDARERLILAAYDELAEIYASDREPADKLERKAAVLRRLESALGSSRQLNNAFLVGFRTYRVGHESFSRLLAACRGDWRRFVDRVAGLDPTSFAGEQSESFGPVIDRLAGSGCGASAAR